MKICYNFFMKILGIESSCDDTGIALLNDNKIIENIVLTQEHKNGVIPEYAARAHHQALYDVIKPIIQKHEIDLIAYTNGPGLIGGLFVGASFAKGLAYGSQIPLIGVDHLKAHIILPYWLEDIELPYLCVLVSGGHTMIILVKDIDEFQVLSTTIDDAAGEVFDKVARNIGLKYPGGPEIEKMAYDGDSEVYKFPHVMYKSMDFSFSGLKTAAIRQITIEATHQEKADFCASFQKHMAFLLTQKMEKIIKKHDIKNWVISGGVAANKVVRSSFDVLAKENDANIFYPLISLCTDNGVMIAALGGLMFEKYGPSELDLEPFAQSDI